MLFEAESTPRLLLTTLSPTCHVPRPLSLQWLWVAKSEDRPEYKGAEAAINEATEYCACILLGCAPRRPVVTDSGVSVAEVTERVQKIQV